MSRTKASLCVVTATALTVMTLFLLPFSPKPVVYTAPITRGDLLKTTLLEGVIAYGNERPCVTLAAGKLRAAHVTQGQQVAAGDLLFSLDTAAEEEALAALSAARYESQRAAERFGAAATAALSLNGIELWEREQALLQSVSAKRIRADISGVMGAVYAQEGDMLAAGSLLGTLHSRELCVAAVCRPGAQPEAKPGAVAAIKNSAGKTIALARLAEADAPQSGGETGQLAQRVTFTAVNEQDLRQCDVGERVTVEWLNEALSGVALAPIEAVGQGNRLWVVTDGTASPLTINIEHRNGEFARVPDELLGQSVILLPDDAELTAGCQVREAKRR